MSKDIDILQSLIPTTSSDSFLQNEWRYLDPIVSKDSEVSFDNKDILTDWISLKDAFLSFTIVIPGGAATKLVAFKRTLLDIFKQIQLTINTQDVFARSNCHHYNHFNLVLNKSSTFKDSADADWLMLALDDGKVAETAVTGADNKPTGLYDGGGAATANSSVYERIQNKGFTKRVTIMGSYLDGNAYKVPCRIPLKYLHPIFETDLGKMPLNQLRFQLTLLTNLDYSTYCPLYEAGGSITGAITIDPNDRYKLWYRYLIFNPQQSLEVAEFMKSESVKTIKFVDYVVGSEGIPAGTTSKSIVLNNATVLPQRVYFASYSNRLGTLVNEQKDMSPGVTLASPNMIKQFNISINNTRYYDRDITNGVHAYSVLQDSTFPESDVDGYSPLIPYKIWDKYHHIYVANLGYLKSRASDPTTTCNVKLEISSFEGATDAHNIVFAIESLYTLVLSYKDGKAFIVKKQE